MYTLKPNQTTALGNRNGKKQKMPESVPTNDDFYRELCDLVEEQAKREGIEANEVLVKIYDILEEKFKREQQQNPVVSGLDF
jgi:hypothetical protein